VQNNQHYALNCTTPLFNILAPTCFGSSLPSSGSFLDASELLEIQTEWVVYYIMCGYVVCVPDCCGSWWNVIPPYNPQCIHINPRSRPNSSATAGWVGRERNTSVSPPPSFLPFGALPNLFLGNRAPKTGPLPGPPANPPLTSPYLAATWDQHALWTYPTPIPHGLNYYGVTFPKQGTCFDHYNLCLLQGKLPPQLQLSPLAGVGPKSMVGLSGQHTTCNTVTVIMHIKRAGCS
jgi:hypothetical protein